MPRVGPSAQTITPDGGGDYYFPGGLAIHLEKDTLPPGSVISVSAAPDAAVEAASAVAAENGPQALVVPFAVHTVAEPRKPARISLTLRGDQRSAGDVQSFVASFQSSTSSWHLEGGTYDPALGILTVTVSHFSIFGFFKWLIKKAASWVWNTLTALFLPSLSPVSPPQCDPQVPISWKSSPPDNGLLPHCGQAQPDGSVLVKIVSARSYTLEVTTEQGPKPLFDPEGGLAAVLARWITSLDARGTQLLPGHAEATVVMARGDSSTFRTEPSGVSFALDVLQAALGEYATLGEKLGLGRDQDVAKQLGDALDASECGAQLFGGGLPNRLDSGTAVKLLRLVVNCFTTVNELLFHGVASYWKDLGQDIGDLLVKLPIQLGQYLTDPEIRQVTVAIPSMSTPGAPKPPPGAPAAPTSRPAPLRTPLPPPQPTPWPSAPPSVTPSPTPAPPPPPTQTSVVEYNCDDLAAYKQVTVPTGTHWSMDIYPSAPYITGGHIIANGNATVRVGIYYGGPAYPDHNNTYPVGPTADITVNSSGSQYFTFSPPIVVPTTGSQYWMTFTTLSGTLYVHDNPYELGECIIGTLMGYRMS